MRSAPGARRAVRRPCAQPGRHPAVLRLPRQVRARRRRHRSIGRGTSSAISLAVGLLTLFSMTKIWAGAFWGEPERAPRRAPRERPDRLGGPAGMVAGTAVLARRRRSPSACSPARSTTSPNAPATICVARALRRAVLEVERMSTIRASGLLLWVTALWVLLWGNAQHRQRRQRAGGRRRSCWRSSRLPRRSDPAIVRPDLTRWQRSTSWRSSLYKLVEANAVPGLGDRHPQEPDQHRSGRGAAADRVESGDDDRRQRDHPDARLTRASKRSARHRCCTCNVLHLHDLDRVRARSAVHRGAVGPGVRIRSRTRPNWREPLDDHCGLRHLVAGGAAVRGASAARPERARSGDRARRAADHGDVRSARRRRRSAIGDRHRHRAGGGAARASSRTGVLARYVEQRGG